MKYSQTSDRYSLEIFTIFPCNDVLSLGSRFVFGGENKMEIRAVYLGYDLINSLTRRIGTFVFVTANLAIYRRRAT